VVAKSRNFLVAARFKGRQLQDDRTLGEYHIDDAAVVFLVRRVASDPTQPATMAEANAPAALFLRPYVADIAHAANVTRHAIVAFSDAKVLAGHLHELNGRVRFAKTQLRRFVHAVRRYHTAMRAHIDPTHTPNDPARFGVYVSAHDEIGEALDVVRRAWTTSCRSVAQVAWEPLLTDPVRHDRSCRDWNEFLTALVQQHKSIAREMRRSRDDRRSDVGP